MRILFAIAALVLLATYAPRPRFEPEPPASKAVLSFAPVRLSEEEPARRRLGPLLYLAGWEVSSEDPRFGGISAMHVEGRHVLALSDSGSLFRFSLPAEGGTGTAILGPLPEGPGTAGVKGDRDTEAMAVAGRHAWISFERRNVVWRYDRGSWESDAAAAPLPMRRWRGNRGSEAMLRLPDGRFLIFAEGKAKGRSEVAMFRGDPALSDTRSFVAHYEPPRGYRITDAALLPDGRILFLNRRFNLFEGFSAKLTMGSLPKLREGAVLRGAEVAHFGDPVTVDNFEALSVTREGARTIVWIASDDNYMRLERTLLLKFALVG